MARNYAEETSAAGMQPALRVLLVGDGVHVLPGLDASGHAVQRVETARAAFAAIDAGAPDVLILSWDGFDLPGDVFLKRLRHDTLPATSFVVVTNAPHDLTREEADHAFRAGADFVLPGDAGPATLSAMLEVAGRQRNRSCDLEARLRRVLTKLGDLQKRFDSLDVDLGEARKLQHGLLRDRSVDLSTGQVSGILRSSGHVGGDLVGHFPINDRYFGFFALDVSGHGVSSALMTARLAGYLSAANPRQNIALVKEGDGWGPRSPEDAITDLNELVMEDLETDHYFTMVLGYIEPATGKVTLAQAGHPHPALQRANGSVEFIGEGGLPVGLIPGAYYDNLELTLAPGERLMILSDGFIESTLANGEFLGEEGLVQLLEKARDLKGTALLETLVWDLAQALGEDGAFQDDVSGIAVEYFGNPNS